MEQINHTWEKIVKGVALVGGAIAGALGGWDALLSVLVAMMAIDYVSGVAVAWLGKSVKTEHGGVSSKVGTQGLLKKGLMMLVILIAALLDKAMGAEAPICRDAACWFYIANEGISFLENLALAGVPFPAKLRELLGQQLREADGATEAQKEKPPVEENLVEEAPGSEAQGEEKEPVPAMPEGETENG